MDTKNGFVKVLSIRATPTFWLLETELPLEVDVLLLPHAATASMVTMPTAPMPTGLPRRRHRIRPCDSMVRSLRILPRPRGEKTLPRLSSNLLTPLSSPSHKEYPRSSRTASKHYGVSLPQPNDQGGDELTRPDG